MTAVSYAVHVGTLQRFVSACWLGALAALAPAAAAFSQERPPLGPGDSIRLELRHALGPPMVGSLLSLRDSVLLVVVARPGPDDLKLGASADAPRRRADTLAVLLLEIALLERREPVRFDWRAAQQGAWQGALAGAATGLLAGLQSGDTLPLGLIAIGAAAGAYVGGALAGGGSRARTGAFIGLGAGAVLGAVAGAVTHEECRGWCLGPRGRGLSALAGALVGASIGGLAGLGVGAFARGREWRFVPIGRLRPLLGAASFSRVVAGGSLAF